MLEKKATKSLKEKDENFLHTIPGPWHIHSTDHQKQSTKFSASQLPYSNLGLRRVGKNLPSWIMLVFMDFLSNFIKSL